MIFGRMQMVDLDRNYTEYYILDLSSRRLHSEELRLEGIKLGIHVFVVV